MSARQGRLIPPVKFWYEDEPDGAAERTDEVKWEPDAYGNLNHADATFIEISRTETLLRGGGLFIGLLSLGTVVPFGSIGFSGEVVDILLAIVAVMVSIALAVFGIRLDCRTPTDTPVRFNRKRGKVYIYEHRYRWNPFARWPITIKVFDWSGMHAEIAKQSGVNGAGYAVNYALFISQCKPGTLEVEDRVKLANSSIAEFSLRTTWDYCRLYMTHGLDGLPKQALRRDPGGFFDCFLFAMPVFSPTEDGREARRYVSLWLLSLVMLVVFWIVLPMGLLRYITFKVAPKPRWPQDIDAQSRSAPAA